ncbi:MAG: hypothetical protein KJ063_15450 [Anaerolineae bacterium]|nr:hypothetical protein [Anaerolineae bacterium]
MEIIRDDLKIARYRQLGVITMFVSIGVLLLGLFVGSAQAWSLLALGAGWLLAQVSLYLSNRYVRKPRPDEALDEALQKLMAEKVVKRGRVYHYCLPTPHLLLTSEGIVILIAKYQRGVIVADGDKWRQTRTGLFNLNKYLGQESIGNPTREAEIALQGIINFLNKEVPQVEEVPIAVMIVFTTIANNQLDVQRSRIPAMHVSKVKGYLKQQWTKSKSIPKQDYEAIQQAFDKAARVNEFASSE